MLIQEISKPAASVLPIVSMGSLAIGIYSGRKFFLAGGCKLIAAVARQLEQENTASSLEKSSRDFWTLAKKDAVRDLTAMASFFALAFASHSAGEVFKEIQAEKERLRKLEEEPGFLVKIGTGVGEFIQDYQRPILGIFGFSVLWSQSANFRRLVSKIELLTKLMDLGLYGMQKVENTFKSQFFQKYIFPITINQLNDSTFIGEYLIAPAEFFRNLVNTIEQYFARVEAG